MPHPEGEQMPHHTPLISTIVVGLVLAFALGAVAHRFRISPSDRLSPRRRPGGPLHPRLRGRPGTRQPTRRDRRDPADVRRRPSFLAEGSSRRPRHRDPRRRRADRQRHASRHGPRLADGMDVSAAASSSASPSRWPVRSCCCGPCRSAGSSRPNADTSPSAG